MRSYLYYQFLLRIACNPRQIPRICLGLQILLRLELFWLSQNICTFFRIISFYFQVHLWNPSLISFYSGHKISYILYFIIPFCSMNYQFILQFTISKQFTYTKRSILVFCIKLSSPNDFYSFHYPDNSC